MPESQQETARTLLKLVNDLDLFAQARDDIYTRWKAGGDDWDQLYAELSFIDRMQSLLENLNNGRSETA